MVRHQTAFAMLRFANEHVSYEFSTVAIGGKGPSVRQSLPPQCVPSSARETYRWCVLRSCVHQQGNNETVKTQNFSENENQNL